MHTYRYGPHGVCLFVLRPTSTFYPFDHPYRPRLLHLSVLCALHERFPGLYEQILVNEVSSIRVKQVLKVV